MSVRTLPVKIVYTINPSPHPVVARSKRVPITVISLPDSVDSKTRVEYGKVLLKHCLRAVCDSSPELVCDPKRDFTVYVLDPLEQASTSLASSSSKADQKLHGAVGAAVGMGLMSWCLTQDEDEDEADTLHVLGRLITHPASGEMVEVIISLHETSSRMQRGESANSWASSNAKVSQRPGNAASSKRSLPTPRNTSSPAPNAHRDVVDLTRDDGRSTKKSADTKKPPPVPRSGSGQQSTPATQVNSKPRPGAMPPGPSPMLHPYPYASYPAYYLSAYHGDVPPPYLPQYPYAYYPPPGSMAPEPSSSAPPRPPSTVPNPASVPPKPKVKTSSTTNAAGRRSATPATHKADSKGATSSQSTRSTSQPAQRPITPPSTSSGRQVLPPAPTAPVPSQIVDLTGVEAESTQTLAVVNKKRRLEHPDANGQPRKKLNSDDRAATEEVEPLKEDPPPPPRTPTLAARTLVSITSSPLFSPERQDAAMRMPQTPARNSTVTRIFGSGTGAPLDNLFDGMMPFSPLRDTPGTTAYIIEMGFKDVLSSSPIARVTSQGLSPWSHLQREMALLPPSSPLPPTSSPTRDLSGNPFDDDETREDDDGRVVVKQESPAEQLPPSYQTPSDSSPENPACTPDTPVSLGTVDPGLAELGNEFNEQSLWAGLGPLIQGFQSSPQRAQGSSEQRV